MNPVLIELGRWTVCTLALAAAAQVGIWLFCRNAPHARLTVWTFILFCALVMPIAHVLALVNHLSISITAISTPPDQIKEAFPSSRIRAFGKAAVAHDAEVVCLWSAIAASLLLRVAIGLVLAARIKKRSRFVDQGVRESALVTVPITIGWLRPVILLPANWRSWDARKLAAVLAHERGHVCRLDPIVRLVAACFRSLFWFNPLSWWLYAELSRLMETLSDEAGLEAIRDQVLYAEIVMSFFRDASTHCREAALGMAGGSARARRIDYILNLDLGRPRPAMARSFRLLRPVLLVAALLASLPFTGTARFSHALPVDLSGAWMLNASESIFHNPAPPSKCLLKIQQDQSRIHLVFDFVKQNGRARHQALTLETLGSTSQRTSDGMTISQAAERRGDSIVISEKWSTIASERVFSTSQDRRTLHCQTIYSIAGRRIEDSEVYDRVQ